VSIDFVEKHGTFTGTGTGGRRWQISRTYTGWRLEFCDEGDVRATYAGVHRSLEAAQAEASRGPTTRRR
jgi:hypothetical protein